MTIEGRIVRDRRQAIGMTQEALGEALGYSHTFIGQVERGRSSIPPRKRPEWADVLGEREAVLVVAMALDSSSMDFAAMTDERVKLYIAMTAEGYRHKLEAEEIAELHRMVRAEVSL